MRGLLVGFSEAGLPLVDFHSNPGPPAPAMALVELTAGDIGKEVALLFEDSDASRPIVLGCVKAASPREMADRGESIDVRVDGRQLILSAEKEIVLRCGEASITLTRAGKVLIRGAYLLSRSKGVNRVQGGSVQLN